MPPKTTNKKKASQKGHKKTQTNRARENGGPDFIKVLRSIGDGTATTDQENAWEEYLSAGSLHSAVDITLTLLGVQFRPTNTTYNEIGPRLLFSIQKWATAPVRDALRQAGSTASTASTNNRSHDIALLRLIATQAIVASEDVRRFKFKLGNDEAFRKLYIEQETEYLKTSCMEAENWLRIRMVSQFARAACAIGAPHDNVGRQPHEVAEDRINIERGLPSPANVESPGSIQVSSPQKAPQYAGTNLIESVAQYRWPTLYRPRSAGPTSRLPEPDESSRLSRFKFEQLAFSKKKVSLQGLSRPLELLYGENPFRRTEADYLTTWLSQAYAWAGVKWSEGDESSQGSSSTRPPGPIQSGESAAQSLQGLSLSEASASPSRPARAAAGPPPATKRGPPSRTSSRSSSESYSSHVSSSRRKTSSAPGQDPESTSPRPETLVDVQKFHAYLDQEPSRMLTHEFLRRYFIINTVAANAAPHGTPKQFQTQYLADVSFRNTCAHWVAFYRHCEYRPAWVVQRNIRLQEAIRCVTEHRELPPGGPSLIPGEVAREEAEAMEIFLIEESEMMTEAGFLRPRRHVGVLYDFRRETQQYAIIKARWLIVTQQERQQERQRAGRLAGS